MTPWESYRKLIDKMASRRGDSFVDAEAIVRRIPPNDVVGLMVRLTQREIEKARDLHALTRPRPTPKPDPTPVFAEVFEKPQRLYVHGGPRLNAAARRKFERWCRDNDHDFGEWFNRLLDVTPEKGRELAHLDWIQGYRTPSMDERDRRFWETTMGYVEQFAQAIRLEVTAELLGEQFTLPDGRKVTWADATLDDHERQRNHLGQILGDTAARATLHQQAIDMLCSHDAKTLGEIQQEAA